MITHHHYLAFRAEKYPETLELVLRGRCLTKVSLLICQPESKVLKKLRVLYFKINKKKRIGLSLVQSLFRTTKKTPILMKIKPKNSNQMIAKTELVLRDKFKMK